jgi:hypothetical protein
VAGVNTNIYFCIRTAASGFAFGLAYTGGACFPDTYLKYKTAIMEWEHNDLIVAQVSSWLNLIRDYNLAPGSIKLMELSA